jgi:spore germination protein KA
MEKIFVEISDNKNKLKKDFTDCSDFLLRECIVGGRKCIVCVLDGMINSLQLSQMIMRPILSYKFDNDAPYSVYETIKQRVVSSLEMNEAENFEDAYFFLFSGFAVVFVDGMQKCLVMGIQGFEKRKTGEPSNEPNIKGAKECFTETLNDNKAMLHRRIKSPSLKIKQFKIGNQIKTSVAVCYLESAVDMRLVADVESRILSAPIDEVCDYGEIAAFLDSGIKSYFTAVGNTERPDTLCSKLSEGRVAVLVDGSPYAMYVPYLFTDSFSTVDDYNNRPFYATFNRLLKYFSFVISVILPGFYVAVGTYHQELLPPSLMYTVAAAEASTPFSLMQEAVMVLILYEIMREAGLRLPKAIGHAVSIIGALVIGDAVVNAGLVGAPMLVVVAVTAIASYVIYPLYESISVLRIIFILLGGFTGIYGVMLGVCTLCVNITSLNPYGVPYSSPISPLSKKNAADVFYRADWKKLIKRNVRVQNLRGADIDDD